LLARALSAIAGALAGALIGFFLLRWRAVRICGPASTPRRRPVLQELKLRTIHFAACESGTGQAAAGIF